MFTGLLVQEFMRVRRRVQDTNGNITSNGDNLTSPLPKKEEIL